MEGSAQSGAEGGKGGRRVFLDRMAERLGAAAGVKSAYGEPVERDGVTVIPVAKVAWGFGGGDSSGTPHPARRKGGGPGGGGDSDGGHLRIGPSGGRLSIRGGLRGRRRGFGLADRVCGDGRRDHAFSADLDSRADGPHGLRIGCWHSICGLRRGSPCCEDRANMWIRDVGSLRAEAGLSSAPHAGCRTDQWLTGGVRGRIGGE